MKQTFLLLLFSLAPVVLAAQSVTPTVVASAGGSGEVGTITVMWTVGEVAVTTLRANDLTVTQGFHQPPPGTTDAPREVAGAMALDAVPNPVTDYLNVTLPVGAGTGELRLVDLLGRSVLVRPVSAGVGGLTLEVSSLPTGTYIARYVAGDEVYTTTVTVQR